MQHILFYTDTPNVGGAEKHMFLLARYLKQKGLKVSLVYGQYSQLSNMHDAFEDVCEKVHVLPVSHKHDPRHYFELKKILSQNKFDLIHLHLWNPGSARYAFFAAAKMNLPIVTTEHDPFELTGMKKWIKQLCLKKVARKITVSQDNFRLLGDYYDFPQERLEMVSNGIELDIFLDKMDSRIPTLNPPQNTTLPVQEGAVIITCIAELHPRKGHKYLLEAFRKLQTIMPKVELLLIGRGPIEDELKNQYSELQNVHFLGWREDIPQLLKSSDIFVLPSLKEAFGQVILEAMASGVAVIATNNGGPVDIIQDGVTGHLVPPGNSEAIFQKMCILLQNPHQKKDMEKAALERVQKEFTAETMAEKTLNVYRKTVTSLSPA